MLIDSEHSIARDESAGSGMDNELMANISCVLSNAAAEDC